MSNKKNYDEKAFKSLDDMKDYLKDCLTIEEVTEITEIDRRTIIRRINNGDLPAVKLGRNNIKIHKDHVPSLVKKLTPR